MRWKYNPEINLSHIIALTAYLMGAIWFGSKVDTTIDALLEITRDHEGRIRVLERDSESNKSWHEYFDSDRSGSD